VTFSNRTPGDLSLNPIAGAIERLKGQSILDLTESNPTRCGFDYPSDLLSELSSPAVLRYEPFPFGHPRACRAVADYLKTKGHAVDPDRIVLTASTSEAYSFLFKLLGGPGDGFLIPTPGYPLLDHLLQMEGLEMLPYPLRTTEGWPVDLEKTRQAAGTGCRGLVVVNPHNPTGTFLSRKDQEALGDLCEKNQWAYISDEVFADYAYPGRVHNPWVPAQVLSFRMGGLSKSLGLPQLKLSWILLDGPSALLEECRDRLELIADTYLSVNTPVQLALEGLFRFAPLFQKQLMDRVLENRRLLEEGLNLNEVRLWPAQGGWYALVEITKKGLRDDQVVLELIEKHRVLVQPGAFYDFSEGSFLVLSLLPKTQDFREGVSRMADYFKGLTQKR